MGKSKYIILGIILAIVLVIAGCLIYSYNTQVCPDKGGSKTYFDKQYLMDNYHLFFNKTNVQIPKDEIVAQYAETARCTDGGSYYMRTAGSLKKVTKDKFDEFIALNNNSLLVQVSQWWPSGIFDWNGKPICGLRYNYLSEARIANCTQINIDTSPA